MKFSVKFTNKLVSYVDRYFTYDNRKMKREGDATKFDFIGYNHEDNCTTTVFVKRSKYGIWVSIHRGSDTITQGFLETYVDITNFKKMIKCLG